MWASTTQVGMVKPRCYDTCIVEVWHLWKKFQMKRRWTLKVLQRLGIWQVVEATKSEILGSFWSKDSIRWHKLRSFVVFDSICVVYDLRHRLVWNVTKTTLYNITMLFCHLLRQNWADSREAVVEPASKLKDGWFVSVWHGDTLQVMGFFLVSQSIV